MRSNLPQDPLNWKFGELRTKLLAQAMCGQLVAIPATPSLAANYDLAPTTAAYEPLVLPSHWQWTRLDTLGKLITDLPPSQRNQVGIHLSFFGLLPVLSLLTKAHTLPTVRAKSQLKHSIVVVTAWWPQIASYIQPEPV